MGRDKASLELGGVPLATRLGELLSRFFLEVLLVGGEPPRGAPGRFVPDTGADSQRCALRGLVSALEHASAERVLVLATDMPLVTPDLILGLTAWPEHDAVLPRREGLADPLCAIYRREPALAVATEHLRAGDLALGSLLDALDSSYIEGPDLDTLDPDRSALYNLNRLEDLERAEAMLRARSAT